MLKNYWERNKLEEYCKKQGHLAVDSEEGFGSKTDFVSLVLMIYEIGAFQAP